MYVTHNRGHTTTLIYTYPYTLHVAPEPHKKDKDKLNTLTHKQAPHP